MKVCIQVGNLALFRMVHRIIVNAVQKYPLGGFKPYPVKFRYSAYAYFIRSSLTILNCLVLTTERIVDSQAFRIYNFIKFVSNSELTKQKQSIQKVTILSCQSNIKNKTVIQAFAQS